MVTKKITYIAMLAVLLCSCGVKKGAVSEWKGLDAKVIAERATMDALARKNTILPENVNHAWLKQFSGQYVLANQQMPVDSIAADSLVLTENGYYYTYKQGEKVEYGRFNIRQNASDPEKFLMDWFSCYRDYHCYLVLYRANEHNKSELEFIWTDNDIWTDNTYTTTWIER